MANFLQKLFTSRVPADASTFVGEDGRMFYNQADGILRLSDGVTPGGIIVGGGGTSNLTYYDCGTASTNEKSYVLYLDMGSAN